MKTSLSSCTILLCILVLLTVGYGMDLIPDESPEKEKDSKDNKGWVMAPNEPLGQSNGSPRFRKESPRNLLKKSDGSTSTQVERVSDNSKPSIPERTSNKIPVSMILSDKGGNENIAPVAPKRPSDKTPYLKAISNDGKKKDTSPDTPKRTSDKISGLVKTITGKEKDTSPDTPKRTSDKISGLVKTITGKEKEKDEKNGLHNILWFTSKKKYDVLNLGTRDLNKAYEHVKDEIRDFGHYAETYRNNNSPVEFLKFVWGSASGYYYYINHYTAWVSLNQEGIKDKSQNYDMGSKMETCLDLCYALSTIPRANDMILFRTTRNSNGNWIDKVANDVYKSEGFFAASSAIEVLVEMGVSTTPQPISGTPEEREKFQANFKDLGEKPIDNQVVLLFIETHSTKSNFHAFQLKPSETIDGVSTTGESISGEEEYLAPPGLSITILFRELFELTDKSTILILATENEVDKNTKYDHLIRITKTVLEKLEKFEDTPKISSLKMKFDNFNRIFEVLKEEKDISEM